MSVRCPPWAIWREDCQAVKGGREADDGLFQSDASVAVSVFCYRCNKCHVLVGSKQWRSILSPCSGGEQCEINTQGVGRAALPLGSPGDNHSLPLMAAGFLRIVVT